MVSEYSCSQLEVNKILMSEEELIDYFKMDFRDIEDYEGLYAINTYCDIWSYKRQRFLKPRLEYRKGVPYYWRVDLYKGKDRKTVRLHKLLAQAYVPNFDPDRKQLVGHNDDNKQNLELSNLYWTDYKENNTHNDIHKRKRKYKVEKLDK